MIHFDVLLGCAMDVELDKDRFVKDYHSEKVKSYHTLKSFVQNLMEIDA